MSLPRLSGDYRRHDMNSIKRKLQLFQAKEYDISKSLFTDSWNKPRDAPEGVKGAMTAVI